MSPVAVRVQISPKPGLHRCPKCGSSQTCPSRRRSLKDWLLFVLFLNPQRCTQCLRRFFRFRSHRAQRAVMVTLFLIPVIVLAAWFIELRSLQKVRALSTTEQSKPDALKPVTVQQLLDKR